MNAGTSDAKSDAKVNGSPLGFSVAAVAALAVAGDGQEVLPATVRWIRKELVGYKN